jgi:hypothetical protein
MPDGGAAWREVIDQHHSRLIDELSTCLDSERREAAAQAAAGERARATAQIECLNQVLRRMRAAGEAQVLHLLAEGCAPCAERLVVLVFESNQTRAAAGAGLSAQTICFDTAAAPAVVAAVESRDRVTALASPGELSPVLADAFGGGSDDRKVYLFPIVSRHSVVAVLVASDAGLSAQIELLCEAAGLRLEAAQAEAKPAAAAAAVAPSWERLGAGDQKLHMQAQRMARVRVAEMRLEHAAELNKGAAAGDIYAALRQPIDTARDQFRAAFLEKSPSMVDYLHMEILRSFARDDERLLGANYPGPMNAEPHV